MLLTETFAILLEPYASQETIDSLWQEIKSSYTHPSRYYHNLDHIQDMIQKWEELKDKFEQPELVALAIFYHDIIYTVSRKDNEEKSADLAMDCLKPLGLKQGQLDDIHHLILATKAHELSEDSDANFLLDLDLMTLGKDRETYKEYVKNIRKEYKMYPDFFYKPGRKKVLKHFLAMESIYKTVLFQESHEAQARANLLWELNEY